MRAAVIGTNWGRVHIHALRQAGMEVVGLCSTDRVECQRVAEAEGIEHACDRAADLLSVSPDLVTIATPASSHGVLLRQFRDLAVICEKPVLGYRSDPDLLQQAGDRVWVNYAFAFLDSAGVWLAALETAGPITAIELHCEFNLPLNFNGPQWFLEVASHPLSLLVHRFGAPRAMDGQLSGNSTCLALQFAPGIPCLVHCSEGGEQGIRQRLSVTTDVGELLLRGGFAWGGPWRYQPVTWNGQPLNDGEFIAGDCWLRANQRSIATMVRQLRGELSVQSALAAGLFDPPKAAAIDRCINQVL